MGPSLEVEFQFKHSPSHRTDSNIFNIRIIIVNKQYVQLKEVKFHTKEKLSIKQVAMYKAHNRKQDEF